MTGVINPSSIATAMATWTSFQYRMWSSCHQALHSGCCRRAVATALRMMSLNDTFSPPPASSASRASAERSMSTSVVR